MKSKGKRGNNGSATNPVSPRKKFSMELDAKKNDKKSKSTDHMVDNVKDLFGE